MRIREQAKREQLIRDGFCIFENVLDAGTVAKLNAMSEWTISQEDPEHFQQHRAQGCIIPYWKFPHPAFAELLADPRALAVFADMGFERPRAWSGFVISKPPHAPPLYWHQDGVLWDHPISYTDRPQQYFLMYYLVDTDRDNGCLRVIPGSHRKRHPLHDLPRQAHESDEVGTAANLEHPALQPAAGEVDVPVRAGDVVVGDARLFHSAHANRSDERRTVLTIWYWPAYDELPEEVQALIAGHVTERSDWSRWLEQARPIVGDVMPVYDGAMEPATWNNIAGPGLK